MDRREEFWVKAFNAALSSGAEPSDAERKASVAQRIYEAQWPSTGAVALGAGMSVGTMGEAVAALKSQGRWDAAAVLESFFEAVKRATERGESVKWMPPMRGA